MYNVHLSIIVLDFLNKILYCPFLYMVHFLGRSAAFVVLFLFSKK